jgi:hypothetical protein
VILCSFFEGIHINIDRIQHHFSIIKDHYQPDFKHTVNASQG